MNMTELDLSDILKDLDAYKSIEDIAVIFTDSPIEDFKRGWSYRSRKPKKDPLEVIGEEMRVDTLADMDGELFNIDDIERRIKNRFAHSEGEEVLLRISQKEQQVWYAPLNKIKDLISKEDWKVLYRELLDRFEDKTKLIVEYDKSQKGWFLAERGLISCIGDNLIDSLCKAELCQDLIGYYSDFKYILAFHPSRKFMPSEDLPEYIVAAEPDRESEFYVINVDTDFYIDCEEVEYED